MSSLDSLLRQVSALRAKVGRESDPMEWVFMLAQGETIPDVWQEAIREQDSVLVREYPVPYMEDESPSCGWYEAKGEVVVLYRDGRKEKVHAGHSRTNRRRL